MLERVASSVMVRRWTFAAAGVGLVIAIVIATAPKPHCKCTGTRSAAVPVSVLETTSPCTPAPTFHALTTAKLVERELACAERMAMSPRRAFLALMRARALDVRGDYTPRISRLLARHSPGAAEQFLVLKDYQNAASAMLVGQSLGVESPAFHAVRTATGPM